MMELGLSRKALKASSVPDDMCGKGSGSWDRSMDTGMGEPLGQPHQSIRADGG